MNRPIKFRIWDTETQIFLQELAPYYWHVPRSLGLFDDEIVGEANLHDLSALLSNKGFIAQQFTGLLDKSGREIYEGDICKWKWAAREGQIEESTGEAFFENGVFYFGRDLYFCTADVNFDELSLEVIGNIFESAA